MPYNVLIVEDQPLLAMGVEDAVEALGHRAIGIASNMSDALKHLTAADIALVDVNLDDGPTGPEIGLKLANAEVSVLFMTSDPASLGKGVQGTLGVIEKPMMDIEMTEAIQFAVDCRSGSGTRVPPRRLKIFAH
jgi:DNA-binding NarL/FixJ family response regulator